MSIELSDFVVPPSRAAGLSPTRRTLDNGVVVIGKESRKTPAVTIHLVLTAGSICDPADAPGAMHLLSRVIDRGTAARSAAEIAETLEDHGASLSINVSRHLFSLVCTCLAEDFERVLALLADIVMSPSVPESELAVRKGEVITQIRQDQDSPAVCAVEQLMALLYGAAHPYGRLAKGTVESVEQTTREQLLALHAARFAPGVLSVVIVGDVDLARAFDVVDGAFGTWRAATPPPAPLGSPIPAVERRRIVVPMMNKAQADIAYGFTTITRADPDYYAFWLLNVVLGHYAMGGRLGDNIRERQGMAYYASSTFDPNLVAGPLLVRAGVSAANVDRALHAIDDELTMLSRDGITEQELSDARGYMIGSMPRALETNAGIAQFLQTSEFFGLGLDYEVRMPDLLGEVTADHVRALARRYLDPARASIVIAGPYSAE
jgi:zinc protease